MAGLFWISLIAFFYIYVGYPILVWLAARCVGREPRRQDITPPVSLVIPAYNEEAHIEAKIRNSLQLDYPLDRLEIVVASDGSTDRTNALVAQFAADGIRLLAMPEHMGKSGMLNRVVPLLRGEMIVFSDASSELEPDALRYVARNFADPAVGCVSGLYRLKDVSDLRSEGEGLYWRYETMIKQCESRLHSILGAHGAFYAIRRSLFHPLEGAAINDDYLIPMRIVAQGYRAVYEPEARAWEREPASVGGEFARRRRIAAGNCQQVIALRQMLTMKYGWVAWSFFSHKVLRTLAPLFMITLLCSTPWAGDPVRTVAFALQGALYSSAWLGYRCHRDGQTVKWLSPPLYFCLGNLAMLAGLLRFCSSRQAVMWERAR